MRRGVFTLRPRRIRNLVRMLLGESKLESKPSRGIINFGH